MCGFVGFTGNCTDKQNVIKFMLNRILHRGPDSQDYFITDNITFGFARLSIIDINNGSQPMQNTDKSITLVFNGEIYNYQEIRKDLIDKGHNFKTNSDTEVIIHGYEQYGKNLLDKLRGMFAFAIWDNIKKSLFIARDFFGIKPLYYYNNSKTFIFGSEIKSFLPHPDFVKILNESKLPDYLSFNCVPGYETFFKDVYCLPPGHYLEFNNNSFTVNQYFSPSFNIDNSKNMDYFVSKISTAVKDSVEKHNISDVEVGCFLSSGVDSSYVAAELSKLHPIKTYTIGFDDKRYSEAENAKVLADEINSQNYVNLVSSKEYLENHAKVQYHLDEPLANPSANLLFFISKTAAKDLKVVLSGEGADEMFGGYNIYKEPLSLQKFQKLSPKIRKLLAKAVAPIPNFKGKGFIMRASKSIEQRYIGISNNFKYDERDRYLSKKFESNPPSEFTKQFYNKVSHLDDITKMQYLDIHVWMVQEILLKADKMSMAHSLELRVPFLDIEIFKLASTIPTKYKVNKSNTKLALRKAALKLINPTSANRVKMAFPLPLTEWIRQDDFYYTIKSYFESNFAPQFFNIKNIKKLLEDTRQGKAGNVSKIWTIFTFLVWYEQYFIKN